ncbi:MAG: 4-alpha-glucanotransferase [Deltaproteobacteria bacterium]|nr:4-alpha-glucanotransferase [Deltaproteobacteria bacterium]
MRRGSGLLLHITSLPSPCGIGDLGPSAYHFADFLAQARQSYWQILPLTPADPYHGSSPYHSFSAFAGNPLLISVERMVQDGFLSPGEFVPPPICLPDRVDHSVAIPYKNKFLSLAYERFKSQGAGSGFEEFCHHHSSWLEDFALFTSLTARFGGKAFTDWPAEVRDRDPQALQKIQRELEEPMGREKFIQYLFHLQWSALRGYCRERSIQIIGDLPIYVQENSADVWSHGELFQLDEGKRPLVIAGVPPDSFSETGQRWGNPLYNWRALKERGYAWWVQRMEHTLGLYDFVRVDHFRGLVAYWEIPAREETAIHGRWVEGPGGDLLRVLFRRLPCLPVIAEDLGQITPEVREIMRQFALPGMKVLLFAFDGDPASHPYLPHNYGENCIVFTGTHDNNTARGWFEREAGPEEKRRLFAYLGREVGAEALPGELIRLAMMSVARVAMIPVQDLLGLGEEARMNRPATLEGNWQWKLSPGQLTPESAERFRKMTEIYGRA